MVHSDLEYDHTRMTQHQALLDSEAPEALPTEHAQLAAPQAVEAPEKEAVRSGDYTDKEGLKPSEPSNTLTTSRFTRKPRTWLLFALIVITILVIAIAVPLAIENGKGTGDRDPHSNATAASSASNPSISSGALKATRLATFNPNPLPIPIPNTYVFYQDYTSKVRRLQKIGSAWSEESETDSPVIDLPSVKEATPLASVNYTDPRNDVPTAHLFYVDQSNILQEMISTDNLTNWHLGPLGNSSFQISPKATQMAIINSQDRTGGSSLRLYYGNTDGRVQEIVYALTNSSWTRGYTFQDTNGDAGIATGAFDPVTGFAQLYTLDTENNNNIWAWNINTTATRGVWKRAPTHYTTISAQNTSLAWAIGYLSYQDNSGVIKAVKVHPDDPLGDPWGESLNVGGHNPQRATQGSALLAASVWQGEHANLPFSLDLWWQGDENDIVECLDIGATPGVEGFFNITTIVGG